MDESRDPVKANKKFLPLSKFSSVFPTFLLSLFVLLPLFLVVLLPLTIVSLLIKALFSIGRKSTSKTSDSTASVAAGAIQYTEPERRPLDIVVFGATGFTGKIAAKYLAKQYGSTVKWGIAGRRQSALEEIKADCLSVSTDSKLAANFKCIVADSNDEASLRALANQTRVIVSTAGPFAKFGSLLVRVCAETGTHYCDITGEADWVREMIDKHDDTARRTNARIVHFCGHDCVPWDLIVQQCDLELKKKNESMNEVRLYDEINSNPSGGTMATIQHALSHRPSHKNGLGFDPFLKLTDGTKASHKYSVANQTLMGYNSECRAWVGPFLMAWVMSNCVRRSNAINNYGPKLKYKEAMVFPNFFAAFVTMVSLMLFGSCLMIPPLCTLLYKFVLPAPGEGPSEKSMDKGFLKITAVAEGSAGSKVGGYIYFPTDPGYRDTARMLVESGLALALNLKDITAGGGVWTPASCQGPVLLQRLVATGTSYSVRNM